MVEQRSIGIYILLSIVTCGIFALYWFVCLTNDVNTVSGDINGTSGGVALLLTIVTCGIYGWYWAYKQGDKIDFAKRQRGVSSTNTGILYLLLSVFGLGIIAYALMQDELNSLA